MTDSLYQQARKLGLKELKTRQARKEDPYLPALDELLPHAAALAEEDLGTVRIDLEQVVGTRSAARRDSFSASFYPLLDENSEFASKWTALAQSHLEEGIREPIRVVEYLNRFYVQEGHKRVSVLRCFGAVSVQATGVRLLPPRSEETEIVVYYEFLDFYRVTRANFIRFERPGRYAELLELLGGGSAVWDGDRRRDFFSDVTRLRKALRDLRPEGGLLQDEVMLRYLQIFGYEHLKDRSPAELRAELETIGPELLGTKEESDPVLLTAPEPQKRNLLKRMTLPAKHSLKAAFLHDKNPESSFWTWSHEQGRLDAQEALGERIETRSCFDMLQDDFEAKVHELAGQGFDAIFTTTPRLLPQTLTAAALYPNIRFLNCSLNLSHPLLRCYYPRMYEAKFLTGVIAGSLCENGRIGFICNYPVFSMPASINAFALGARLVNPRAQIFLQWSTVAEGDIGARFAENGISAFSGRDSFPSARRNEELGLFLLSGGERHSLACSYTDWGKLYQKILASMLDGSWTELNNASDGGRSINYWWGLSSGVAEIRTADDLPAQTLTLLKLLREGIVKGSFRPFEGPIRDQNGRLRIAAGESPSPGEILRMGWLVEGVTGELPDPSALTPEAQALVRLQGVTKDMS